MRDLRPRISWRAHIILDSFETIALQIWYIFAGSGNKLVAAISNDTKQQAHAFQADFIPWNTIVKFLDIFSYQISTLTNCC